MRRTRRARVKPFAEIKVLCPRCPGTALQYYGKPDPVAFLRDAKPVRFWCPKCHRKFDAHVTAGLTEEETKRTIRPVDEV